MTLTYLVTGGAGFIGSHLTDALAADGHHVVVLDDLSTGRVQNLTSAVASGNVEFVEGSILDACAVETCLSRADACIHLAAWVGVGRILDHPLEGLRGNVLGTDNVMAAAARHNVPLVFSSSSEVYGKLNQTGLTESDDRLIGSPDKSRWSYAIAKEFGEALANAYSQELGRQMTIVRLFNTVGPRQASAYGMVLPRFVRQALADQPLTVYGDGTQTRCFTDVGDIVAALRKLTASKAAAGRTFNIGSNRPTRVLDLANRVIAQSGSKSVVTFVPYSEAHSDGFEELGNRAPDTAALHALTGWQTERTLEQTIDAVIAYERDQQHPWTMPEASPFIAAWVPSSPVAA